jgi:hypothetical protein
MHGFELFLLETGYIKTSINDKTISSLSSLDRRYEKEGSVIIFGLSEKGKPPTIVYPRPIITNGNISKIASDDDINRILINKPCHEVILLINK